MNELQEKPQLNIPVVMCSALPKCDICNDTGKVKYKDIEWCMYSWQPWLTKDCRCKDSD